MIDIKAIRAAAEAATPGPWEAAGPSFGAPLPKYLNCVGWITEDDEFEDVCTEPLGSDGYNSADMNYIATANPAAILELLDRLEAAEKDAARYVWWRDTACRNPSHVMRLLTPCIYSVEIDDAIDAAMKDGQK